MPEGFTIDPPVVTALLTCDNLTTSLIDQKPSYVGVWDAINAPQFPWIVAITAVATLVGVLEQIDAQMSIVLVNNDLTESSVPFGAVSVVQPPPAGQGVTNTIIVHTPHIFQGPGRYDLRLTGNGALLAYKPIIVQHIQLPQGGSQ